MLISGFAKPRWTHLRPPLRSLHLARHLGHLSYYPSTARIANRYTHSCSQARSRTPHPPASIQHEQQLARRNGFNLYRHLQLRVTSSTCISTRALTTKPRVPRACSRLDHSVHIDAGTAKNESRYLSTTSGSDSVINHPTPQSQSSSSSLSSSSSSSSLLSSSQPPSPSASSSSPSSHPPPIVHAIVVEERVDGRRRRYTHSDGALRWAWVRRTSRLGLLDGPVAWLQSLFLPIGYPSSVHKSYLRWSLNQGFESYVSAAVSVLCNQAMLASLGVGAPESYAGAIAIQWVMKDGIGELGKMMFIKLYSGNFDSYPKTWKLIGEILLTVGSGLQLCTVVAPSTWFLALASAGNMLKCVAWVIWSLTHMVFVRNLSSFGNVADVSAKSESQSSLAQILGWISGVAIISFSHSAEFLFAAYIAFSPLHLWATWRLIREAEFESLNVTKVLLIASDYLATRNIPTAAELRPKERWLGEFANKHEHLPSVVLGVPVVTAFHSFAEVAQAADVFKEEKYLLNWHNGKIYVVFKEYATTATVMKSMLHATKFHELYEAERQRLVQSTSSSTAAMTAHAILECIAQSLKWTNDESTAFRVKLKTAGWKANEIVWNDKGIRASFDMKPLKHH